MSTGRRGFLQQIALAPDALAQVRTGMAAAVPESHAAQVTYPRVFRDRQLAMIAFPFGGVGAGSLALGGRGQLRDWQIFNRADKGNSSAYAFPSVWVSMGGGKPLSKVIESRILPPYEGEIGLGYHNVPGLERFASARFTGEYPLARIDFEDRAFPVNIALEAFTPFIPHDPDDSGLPVALLRYRVRNPSTTRAEVSIAFSIDNPVAPTPRSPSAAPAADGRENVHHQSSVLEGLLMHNPALPATDPLKGSFALCVLRPPDGKIGFVRGWERGPWWNSPLLFWDDFSRDGELREPESRNGVGAIYLKRAIPPGGSTDYTFLLAWHFPNRTPAVCGWNAPKGDEDVVIGNFYTTRFKDALDAAEYAASNLERLERQTRTFAQAIRESTLPDAVKDAATANLSTLASPTCFRTADGEFHGFEGSGDKLGLGFGNCTHVWNYETATAHLFPSLARSLRKAAFGYSMDEAGAMHFRQLLPDGKARSGFAAADGQMGQIVHAYLDWRLSGDTGWLRQLWPRIKKAIEFAWRPGGWDADRDGIMEGVQHNTYDVEFYGPNPQCGIYYLAGLRAAEEMARALGDDAAEQYHRLFESGSRWIDHNLFNGEYYVQQIRGCPKDRIAPALRGPMGTQDTEHPEYQVGAGCLVDQLVGQYLATVTGLGDLLDTKSILATLRSIYRYNHKPTLLKHNSVQRVFALNDEAAMVICDYGKAERPRIPFPYFAEVMTGFEYSTAAHMLYAGMTEEGLRCVQDIRARYDGERRNPWDEAEYGHHYARAMASWSTLLALSGFEYDGAHRRASILPRTQLAEFRCFWSTGTGWGTFRQNRSVTRMRVLFGSLPISSMDVPRREQPTSAAYQNKLIEHTSQLIGNKIRFEFQRVITLGAGEEITLQS